MSERIKKIIELDCPSCGKHWTGFDVDVFNVNGLEFDFTCPLCKNHFRFGEKRKCQKKIKKK